MSFSPIFPALERVIRPFICWLSKCGGARQGRERYAYEVWSKLHHVSHLLTIIPHGGAQVSLDVYKSIQSAKGSCIIPKIFGKSKLRSPTTGSEPYFRLFSFGHTRLKRIAPVIPWAKNFGYRPVNAFIGKWHPDVRRTSSSQRCTIQVRGYAVRICR